MKTKFDESRTTTIKIRQMLHVIALLQNNKDPHQWNYKTLTDKIANDSRISNCENTIGDTSIKTCVKNLKEDTELKIVTTKGARSINPIEIPNKEYLSELLNVYSSMIITDATRNSIIKRLIAKNETECMWNIAMIYFASVEKKMISFTYTNNDGVKKDNIIFKPFHLIAKGHSIYLLGKRRDENVLKQYTFEKIENVRSIPNPAGFDDIVPEPDTYFKYSISPFMAEPVMMKIRYERSISQEIRQILNILGEIEQVGEGIKKKNTTLEITEYEFDNHFEASFKIADYKHLLKHIFYYGNSIEILKPSNIRNEMKKMLEDSLSIYVS